VKNVVIEIEHYNRKKEKININSPVCERNIQNIVSDTVKSVLRF
jgi:hypothetical protein